MENNFIQMAASAGHARACTIGTKIQGSSPRPDIKMKYEKYFFSDFLSADFWQIQIAMKSFSKNLSFEVDFKL